MGKNIISFVYTIGYEKISIGDFIKFLVQKGIKRIIDVRRNPISRKRGFSKNMFASIAGKSGIQYLHERAVGIPSEVRRNLNSEEDYKRVLDNYEKNLLPEHSSEVKAIAKLAQETPTVLVCFEGDPNYCHRTRLANVISRRYGVKPTHLRIQ